MSKKADSDESKSIVSPYYGSVSPYGELGGAKADGDIGFSFFDLFSLVRRRWEIVLSVMVVGTCSALAYGLTRPLLYEATAALLIEADSKIVDLDSVVEGVGSDAVAIETQINLLKSRGFLESFVEKTYAEDFVQLRVASELDKMKSFVTSMSGQAQAIAATRTDQLSSAQSAVRSAQDETVDIFDKFKEIFAGLKVSQQGRSYIINITYSSPDPYRAEEIANGVAEHYIAEQASRRREITGDASAFLETRLQELRHELIAAEQAVQTYRASKALRVDSGTTLTAEQLTDLTTLVVKARADRREKETRISYIKGLRRNGSKLESLTEVLKSPYMATLWQEESNVRSREAELTLEYGANHPKIQTLATERSEINKKIDLEIDRIVGNMKNELDVLIEREKSLTEDIGNLSNVANIDAANIDKASIKLRLLEGEAAASRRIFEEFLIRLKETRQQEVAIQANTRLVARAQIPTDPTGRSPMVFGLLGIVASSVTGCGLAFLRDKADRNLRSSKEVANALGLPCLGQVPFMSEKKRDGKVLHEYLTEKPVSAYAESIRSIYTKLSMQRTEEDQKVIQITSSLPAEGKTTFAVSLATLLALDGKKTLLVDLDLRHPSVGREIPAAKKTQSLDEFLRGDCGLTPELVYENDNGCDVIGVNSAVKDPALLLRSNRLKVLIKKFRNAYDHIIIDSAPSLGLSDSKATFVHADLTLFVVHWNNTPVDDVVDAIDDLKSCNVEVGGIVLAQVKSKQQRKYGYRGIDQYYGNNEKYYKN